MLDAVVVVVAGIAAGTINAIVGSGSLITFPVLLALGYPPLVANISNNMGLLPGGITGSWGFRREVSRQRGALTAMVPWSVLGGLSGALLLLVLPSSAFDAIVPVLVAVAVVLVALQPLLGRRATRRRETRAAIAVDPGADGRRYGPVVALATLGCGVYGGYFGAAQGVLMMGLFGALLDDPLNELNALKNVLTTVVNTVAAVVFATVAFDRIDWAVALEIGIGTMLGGVIGSRIGRRLPPLALRIVVVVVGLVAFVRLLTAL